VPQQPQQPLLQVILVNRNDISALNEQYLNHSGETDVIAFDLRSDSPQVIDADFSPAVAGEIYVCLDVAFDVAANYGNDPGYELLLYIVHGMLHIAGENDLDHDDRVRMHTRQQQIMHTLAQQLPLAQIFSKNPVTA